MGIVERIKSLAEKENKTLASIERECNLSQGSIRKWDNVSPSIEKMHQISKLFNTTMEYILIGEDKDNEIPEQESELLECYRRLDHRGQCKVTSTAFDELERMAAAERIAELVSFDANAG